MAYSPQLKRKTALAVSGSERGAVVHGTVGVEQIDGLWVARHRTAKAVLRGSFATKEMAVEAKQDWEKKYPS